MDLYLRWRGQESGPHSRDDIVRLLRTGRINPLHQVSSDRQIWCSLARHPDFAAACRPEDDKSSPDGSGPRETAARAAPGLPRLVKRDTLASRTPAQADLPSAAAKRWFYFAGSEVLGPVSDAELLGLRATGVVQDETLICGNEQDPWRPYLDMAPELSADTGCSAAIPQPLPLNRLVPATVWRRLFSAVLDLFVIVAITGLLCLPVLTVASALGMTASLKGPSYVLLPSLFLVVAWLYCSAMEASTECASLGMMSMDLIAADGNGEVLSFRKASMRFLAQLLTMMTLGLGFFVCGISPSKRTLHDALSRTRVVSRASGGDVPRSGR